MNSIMKILGGIFYCYMYIFCIFPFRCAGAFLEDESKYEYCSNCDENVFFVKKMNKGVFWIMVILTCGFWLVPYAFYYVSFKRPVCPQCGKELDK